MLLILVLFTVLLLQAVVWVALFLAKQGGLSPFELAEGTRENFHYQVPEQAHDELGVLVRSFNAMTTQLRDNRSIDQFTRNLQQHSSSSVRGRWMKRDGTFRRQVLSTPAARIFSREDPP